MGRLLVLLSLLVVWVAGDCIDAVVIRLATTTSTSNSGLLNVLLPRFEAASGTRVQVRAVGSGRALRLGRDGRADVVLMHAPEAEARFVADGYGVQNRSVMHNNSLLVGPGADPAGARGLGDVALAFALVARSESPFVSRGDDSGTHKKELALWRIVGLDPFGPWSYEAGLPMAQALEIASERGSYTLVDQATWPAHRDELALEALFEGDDRLFNPYGIIAVNPRKHPGVNFDGARALIEWVTSDAGRAVIRGFRIHGEQLFVPDGDPVR